MAAASAKQMRREAARGIDGLSEVGLHEVRTMSQIFFHLVKLFGARESMRCVLGSLLQRMLSVSSVRQKVESLRVLADLLGSPFCLLQLDGPLDNGTMPDTCLSALYVTTICNSRFRKVFFRIAHCVDKWPRTYEVGRGGVRKWHKLLANYDNGGVGAFFVISFPSKFAGVRKST